MMLKNKMSYRPYLNSEDKEKIRSLVESTGNFHTYEVDIAVELVEASFGMGAEKSGYHFILAENNGDLLGYTCYGPIGCTDKRYDIYWVAVEKKYQGCGIGRKLMEATERKIAECGGKRAYVETSSTDAYLPTRRFYEHFGYIREAELKDYYSDGDNMVIYVHML